MKKVLSCAVVSILLLIFVVISFVTLAVSAVGSYKSEFSPDSEGPYELFLAGTFSGVPIVVSFIILLFVTMPACCCSCSTANKKCCRSTSYVSISVAGSFVVVGTLSAGTALVFYLSYTLDDAKLMVPFVRAIAALNFTTAGVGIATIAASIVAMMTATSCSSESDNSESMEERQIEQLVHEDTQTAFRSVERRSRSKCKCNMPSIIGVIAMTVLLIFSQLATLLTTFGLLVLEYHSKSDNDDDDSIISKAAIAVIFPSGAASMILLGYCIGGPMICTACCRNEGQKRLLSIVVFVWGLLGLGTVVAGGLMTKVGKSLAANQNLIPDPHLDQGSIASLEYLAGGINFATTFVAFSLCCTGACVSIGMRDKRVRRYVFIIWVRITGHAPSQSADDQQKLLVST